MSRAHSRRSARPDTAALTHEKLRNSLGTFEQPAYSPDLSPCDYHMFEPLREELGRTRSDDDGQVEQYVPFYDEGFRSCQFGGKHAYL